MFRLHFVMLILLVPVGCTHQSGGGTDSELDGNLGETGTDLAVDQSDDSSGLDSTENDFEGILDLEPETSRDLGEDGPNDGPQNERDLGNFEPGDTLSLRIHAFDIWAEELREPSLEIGEVGSDPDVVDIDGPFDWVLDHPGEYVVVLEAADHHSMRLRIHFDGSTDVARLAIDNESEEQRQGFSVFRRPNPTGEEPAIEIFLGLRHQWFSASGRPARYGSQLTFLMDGEEAWQLFEERVSQATSTVHASTWWWESNFELLRPAPAYYSLTEEERWGNTVLSLFDSVDAIVRVLVWQDNLLSWLTVDDELLSRADADGDGFEFMGMTNETSGEFYWEVLPFSFFERVIIHFDGLEREGFDPEAPITSNIPPRTVDLTDWPLEIALDVQIASWHQKFFVIDGDEAFVGGMNLRRADWDTSEHLVFEGRRMLFDSTNEEREAVLNEESYSDLGPRKDYMVHIRGPAVQDLEEVFHTRWSYQLLSGYEYSDNATDFAVTRDLEAFEDGVAVQITTTMPTPFWEHSILETWVNAVSAAEQYIFIEDQYWRAPLLTEAIVERMDQRPNLVLIVVTNSVDETTDPGCEWTYITDQEIRSRFPDRYFLYTLRSFDTAIWYGIDETDAYFVDIGIHSKLLIVDDRFLSVGSANKNNRGLIYEGELNIAVLDSAWVAAARERVVENMLGFDTTSETNLPAAFEAAANWNALVYSNWDAEDFDLSLDGEPLPGTFQPTGFVYPLEFRTSDYCLIEGIGADMM